MAVVRVYDTKVSKVIATEKRFQYFLLWAIMKNINTLFKHKLFVYYLFITTV